jgi:hypothetical protein
VVSPDGVKTYGYNKRGQTESVKLGVSNEVFTARIAYDDIGHVKTLDYPQPLDEAPLAIASLISRHPCASLFVRGCVQFFQNADEQNIFAPVFGSANIPRDGRP